jgi:hypothetical protein
VSKQCVVPHKWECNLPSLNMSKAILSNWGATSLTVHVILHYNINIQKSVFLCYTSGLLHLTTDIRKLRGPFKNYQQHCSVPYCLKGWNMLYVLSAHFQKPMISTEQQHEAQSATCNSPKRMLSKYEHTASSKSRLCYSKMPNCVINTYKKFCPYYIPRQDGCEPLKMELDSQ